MTFTFSGGYPFEPPRMQFVTKVWYDHFPHSDYLLTFSFVNTVVFALVFIREFYHRNLVYVAQFVPVSLHV